MKGNVISILIVDGDDPMRELLAGFLSREYHCVAAASAEEAIELLAKTRFNLAIIDQNLPGTSSLELCHIIKQTSLQTIVLIASATINRRFTIEASRRGAFDVIEKSVAFSQIDTAVKLALLLG